MTRISSKLKDRLFAIASIITISGLIIIALFNKTVLITLISSSLIFLGIILFVYLYLRGAFILTDTVRIQDINGSNNIKIDLIQNYQGLSQEVIKQILENEKGQYIEFLDTIEKTKNRLNNQIENLERNGNLNLAIGLLTTIISVFLLIYLVFGEQNPSTEITNILVHYLPRLSIIVFIEIFSLFFLKLYRSNHMDIKYFQNELTNIEAKIIALKAALFIKDSESLKAIFLDLSKTERNFILKVDETTIELARYKMDKDENKSLIENLSKIIEGITKKEK